MANRSVQPFLHRSHQSIIGHNGATWWIRLNLCFFAPIRVHNPNGKLISSAVFAQLIAESHYILQCPFPRIASFHGVIWTQFYLWFLGPVWAHNPNGITTGSAVFAQISAECLYTLQWAAPLPSKLPLPTGMWTPYNTWFLGPTRILNPNSISQSAEPFLQGSLVWQTGR